MKKFAPIIGLILSSLMVFADTPPPGAVISKTYSGNGATAITATGTSLNVNVTNSSGTSTVNQGNAGSQSWLVDVTNTVPVSGTFFQSTQPVSGTFWQTTQPVSGSLGRSWSLLSSTDSVNVGNFPSSQPVTGTFFQATQPVSLLSLPSLVAGSATIGAVNINGTVPVSGTITTTSSSNANTGSAVPTQATMVGGTDGTNLRALKVSTAGVLSVDGSATTQPVSGTFFQATQPVSASSLPLPTGAATSALQTTGNTSLSSIASSTGNIPVQGQALSAASMPVVLPAAQITTLTPPTSVTVTQATGSNLHTQVDASALPSGAATSSLQTTGNTSLATIATNTANAGTPVVSGTVTANIGTTNGLALNSTLGSPFQAGGSIGNTTFGATQATAANLNATVVGTSGASLSTAANQSTEIGSLSTIATNTTGASTSALQTTGNTSLATIATNSANVPVQGLANVTGSQPVALPKATTLTTTAFTSVTGVLNTDMLTGTASGWFDAAGYTSFFADIYTTTTVTGGVITFEQTNDTTNDAAGITMNLQDSTVITQTNVTSLTLAASTIKHYQAPINSRYVRFRISTAFSGTGTVGATVNFRQTPYTPVAFGVAQATAASLLTTATIGSGTVTTVSSVTSDQAAIPGTVSDVASAAITTTTTTATLTPTFGSSYQVNIPVTAVSGTTPTMVVQVNESMDSGTNWQAVYTFPTITATGSYNSPVLPLRGNRIQYVQTITGTTPSFTRAINRLQSSQSTFKAPGGTNFTDRSGTTSGSANTSTLVAAANPFRKYFIIQNLSATTAIYINFTSAANTTSSLYIAPLGSYVMESDTITTESINVLSTGTSIVYSAKEG